MPWRLIGIVIILGFFLLFIGLNLENRCDISFGFTVLKDTPVYLTAFGAFVFGLLCAIPFAVFRRRKKEDKHVPELPHIDGEFKDATKKKWWKKKPAESQVEPPGEL